MYGKSASFTMPNDGFAFLTCNGANPGVLQSTSGTVVTSGTWVNDGHGWGACYKVITDITKGSIVKGTDSFETYSITAFYKV